jgi:hypothetical protein
VSFLLQALVNDGSRERLKIRKNGPEMGLKLEGFCHSLEINANKWQFLA